LDQEKSGNPAHDGLVKQLGIRNAWKRIQITVHRCRSHIYLNVTCIFHLKFQHNLWFYLISWSNVSY
jgi:hypothetical protein